MFSESICIPRHRFLPLIKEGDLQESRAQTLVLHLQAVREVLFCCHQNHLGCGFAVFASILSTLM